MLAGHLGVSVASGSLPVTLRISRLTAEVFMTSTAHSLTTEDIARQVVRLCPILLDAIRALQ